MQYLLCGCTFNLDVFLVSEVLLSKNLGSVVKFNQPVYNVNEDDELVQPKLILSNPSSADITVQVNDDRVIVTGKLDRIKLATA